MTEILGGVGRAPEPPAGRSNGVARVVPPVVRRGAGLVGDTRHPAAPPDDPETRVFGLPEETRPARAPERRPVTRLGPTGRLDRLERAVVQLGLSLHRVAGTDRLRREGHDALADLIDAYGGTGLPR